MSSFTAETTLARPSWMDEAACRTSDPELFFPIGEERTPDRARAAIAVCDRCAVQAHCLIFALRTDQRSGIWGGKTERERAALRQSIRARERRAAARTSSA